MGVVIKRFDSLKNNKKVLLLFGAGVIFYAFFVSLFSIPVHLNVDEELYIAMAKSFHYHGYFEHNGEIVNYSCVLYSMLMSLVYYFYSPEHIMFLLRIVGVICMTSSVFPVYLLGRQMLKDEKKAVNVAALSLIMPSMMDTAYCMQEVLSYPLFLWLSYCVYIEIEEKKTFQITKVFWCILLLSIVCYFTKTYMIFFPFQYILFIVVQMISELYKGNKKNLIMAIFKIFVFCCVYGMLYMIGNFAVDMLGVGYGAESNHYALQFAQLFPVDIHTCLSAASCIVFYFMALLFYWGIIPIFKIVLSRKEMPEKDRKYLLYLIYGIMILIFEIVISIVLTEEGKPWLPHKFLYRYFQIFEIPVLLLFLKTFSIKKLSKIEVTGAIVTLLYMMFYYSWIGLNGRTSIIDAPFFLLIENATKYIFRYTGEMVCLIAIIFLLFIKILPECKISKKIYGKDLLIAKVFLLCFFAVNIIQLPFYTNVIANGEKIQSDAIKVAKYCNAKYPNDNVIYYREASDDGYRRAIYAYLKQDMIVANADDSYSAGIYITGKTDSLVDKNSTGVDLQLELFRLYIVNNLEDER